MNVKTNPLAEILSKKLMGIENVPKAEMTKMVNRAIKAAIEYTNQNDTIPDVVKQQFRDKAIVIDELSKNIKTDDNTFKAMRELLDMVLVLTNPSTYKVKTYELHKTIEVLQWDGCDHRSMWNFLGNDPSSFIQPYGKNFEIDHSKVSGGLLIKSENTSSPIPVFIGDYVVKIAENMYLPIRQNLLSKFLSKEST